MRSATCSCRRESFMARSSVTVCRHRKLKSYCSESSTKEKEKSSMERERVHLFLALPPVAEGDRTVRSQSKSLGRHPNGICSGGRHHGLLESRRKTHPQTLRTTRGRIRRYHLTRCPEDEKPINRRENAGLLAMCSDEEDC